VGVLAVVLVAAGCGGDDDKNTSPTTVASTTPPTTTASPPTSDPRNEAQLASDKAEAERVVLRLTDLPAGGGWTGEPDTDVDTPEDEAARAQVGECLGVDPSLIAGGSRGRAKAESDDFENEQNQEVSNSVTVVSSRERASQQLAAYQKPEAPRCFETFVNQALKSSAAATPGVSIGTARVASLDVPGLNTESAAFRATVAITGEGQTVDLYMDIVLALKGRTGISMTFMGLGAPFPANLETSLTSKVIDRAPAN